MIDKLVEQYSTDIMDKTNPKKQEEALMKVIVALIDDLNDTVTKNNFKKKKELKQEIENTSRKYGEFVEKINKLAGEDLLKANGIDDILKKHFKTFLK